MPFKSEKQRRYLWANEPEIARDWTDTYGSKIHKADGGAIAGGNQIGERRGNRTGFRNPHEETARAGNKPGYGGGNTGGGGHHPGGDHRGPTTYTKPKTQPKPDKEYGLANKNLDRGGIRSFIDSTKNFYRDKIYDRRPHDLKARRNFLMKNDLMKLDPVLDEDEYGDPRYRDSDWLTSREGLEHLWSKGYTGGKLNPADDRGNNPYIWPYEVASAPIEEEVVETVSTDPYAGSYRVRPEFLIAEGGRVPAAFGGIMDSYTGRRAYGLGSIFKKVTKPIKKILKSPIGKLAAMAGLGYLATPGTGTGWAKWLKPGGKGDWWKRVLLDSVDSSGRSANVPGLLSKGKKLLSNPWVTIPGAATAAGLYTAKQPVEDLDDVSGEYDEELAKWEEIFRPYKGKYRVQDEYLVAEGGRIGKQEGGLMDLGGMEKDYRNDGGFVPIGGQEKADDVPARLSRNEFVFTADAVRNAGGGDIDKGAQVMENVMKNLEAGGKVSEESQGQGAQEMFEVSERLSEVV